MAEKRFLIQSAIEPATEPLKNPPTSGFNHIARNTQATIARALQRAMRKGLRASKIFAQPSNFMWRFSLISPGFQRGGGGCFGSELALINRHSLVWVGGDWDGKWRSGEAKKELG